MAANERDLEQWLDVALRQYGAVGIPPELERRITARLAVEQPPPFYRTWLLPAAAAAVAALMLAVWLGTAAGPRANHATRGQAQVAPIVAERGPYRAAPQSKPAGTRRPQIPGRSRGERTATLVTGHSKPAQFPSPRPLSEQEKLLLAFLRQAPRPEITAVIAQERETAITALAIKDLDVPPLAASLRNLERNGRN